MNHFKTFTEQDVEAVKSGVSCAYILEQFGFNIDKKASSQNNQKYKRGSPSDKIIILNHQGKGWWNALADEKGDVIDLYKLLSGKSYPVAMGDLTKLIGFLPKNVPYVDPLKSSERGDADTLSPRQRWLKKRILFKNSDMWNYLVKTRCLSERIVRMAVNTNVIRDGWKSIWFAHTNDEGIVTGAELRGPDTHLCLAHTEKRLFRFQPNPKLPVKRFIITEAAIDALSFASLDDEMAPDTLYASTAGGMSNTTIDSIKNILEKMQKIPGSEFIIATDDDRAGDIFADRLLGFALEYGVQTYRRLPPGRAKDFNQALKNKMISA